MDIKCRFAAGGGRSYSRIPLTEAMEDLCNDNGKLDEGKCRAAFADADPACFSLSDGDSILVFWGATTLLECLHDGYRQMVDSPLTDCADEPQTKQDARLQGRVEDGRCVYVRVRVVEREIGGKPGVAYKIRVDNPNDIVGNSAWEAREAAITLATVCMRIRDNADRVPIMVRADEEILAEAARNIEAGRVRRARERLAECPRRCGGYCSPVDESCPFYEVGGKCGWFKDGAK